MRFAAGILCLVALVAWALLRPEADFCADQSRGSIVFILNCR
jgi:hypothetical protein